MNSTNYCLIVLDFSYLIFRNCVRVASSLQIQEAEAAAAAAVAKTEGDVRKLQVAATGHLATLHVALDQVQIRWNKNITKSS